MSGGLDKASTTESRVLEPLRSGRSKYDMPVVGKKEELLEWPIKNAKTWVQKLKTGFLSKKAAAFLSNQI